MVAGAGSKKGERGNNMNIKRPRWVEGLIALFGGYFWLPCPLCKESFGGGTRRVVGLYTKLMEKGAPPAHAVRQAGV